MKREGQGTTKIPPLALVTGFQNGEGWFSPSEMLTPLTPLLQSQSLRGIFQKMIP